MLVKQLFKDVRDSKLTNLDKLRALEVVTDGFDMVKLEQLQKDLNVFIKNSLRNADIDVINVFAECMYEAFKESNQNSELIAGITKEQFGWFLANDGSTLKISSKLLRLAFEIGLNKHGDSFDRDLADYMELKSFEQMVEAKIQEITKPQEVENPMMQVKSESPYSLDNTKSWFLELCENPDYQRHDGSPYITAIDAELRKRHSHVVGQIPSETTIKNHRRKLGFMQK